MILGIDLKTAEATHQGILRDCVPTHHAKVPHHNPGTSIDAIALDDCLRRAKRRIADPVGILKILPVTVTDGLKFTAIPAVKFPATTLPEMVVGPVSC